MDTMNGVKQHAQQRIITSNLMNENNIRILLAHQLKVNDLIVMKDTYACQITKIEQVGNDDEFMVTAKDLETKAIRKQIFGKINQNTLYEPIVKVSTINIDQSVV